MTLVSVGSVRTFFKYRRDRTQRYREHTEESKAAVRQLVSRRDRLRCVFSILIYTRVLSLLFTDPSVGSLGGVVR